MKKYLFAAAAVAAIASPAAARDGTGYVGLEAGVFIPQKSDVDRIGPPVTNGMMANKLQFGMMGDYPLVVNGFTFQSNPESKSRLIAVAAYNRFGSGNGLVVHKDSPYFELSDLKGKLVSVPFGSAAHGMVLKAMQDRGWPPDYFQLVSQSPEVGSTNLQEKKIDGHADFVPFAELLPFFAAYSSASFLSRNGAIAVLSVPMA